MSGKALFFYVHDYLADYPEEESPMNFVSYFGENGLRDILIEANGRRIIWSEPERDTEDPTHDEAPSYTFEE